MDNSKPLLIGCGLFAVLVLCCCVLSTCLWAATLPFAAGSIVVTDPIIDVNEPDDFFDDLWNDTNTNGNSSVIKYSEPKNIEYKTVDLDLSYRLVNSLGSGGVIADEYKSDLGSGDCKAILASSSQAILNQGIEVDCNDYLFLAEGEAFVIERSSDSVSFVLYDFLSGTYVKTNEIDSFVDLSYPQPIPAQGVIVMQSYQCSHNGAGVPCLILFDPYTSELKTITVPGVSVITASKITYKPLSISPDGNFIIVPTSRTAPANHAVVGIDGDIKVVKSYSDPKLDFKFTWIGKDTYQILYSDTNEIYSTEKVK